MHQNIPALTGLRTLAVGLVIALHNGWGWVGGYIGVDVFFVLSGYLITTALMRREDGLGRFYWKRLLRLTPPLALLLAVYAAVAVTWSPDWLAHLHGVFYAGTYSMNWNMVYAWGPTGYLAHTWSLAIEEQFYLIWAPAFMALALVLRREQVIAVVAACIVLIVAWRAGLALSGESYYRTYHGFDTRADGLLTGCLLALLKSERLGKIAAQTWMLPFAGLFYVAWSVPVGSVAMDVGGGLAVSIMAAWIIAALANGGTVLGRLLALPPMVYLGTISYGLYLWHWPLLGLAREIGIDHPAWTATLATLAISALSWHFLEAPILRFKNWTPRPYRRLSQGS